MNFRFSAVRSVTHHTITEESPTVPADIYPCLIGSGRLGISLDATGFQGLNSRITMHPENFSLESPCFQTERYLHLYQDQLYSRHYSYRESRDGIIPPNFSLMPCGWLELILTIDGKPCDTLAIATEGKDWKRTFDVLTGSVETKYTLGPIQFSWRTCARLDEQEILWAMNAQSMDGKDHSVKVELICHQTLRDGRALWTAGVIDQVEPDFIFRCWDVSPETSTDEVLCPGQVTWALTCDDQAEYHATERALHCSFRGEGTEISTGFLLASGSSPFQSGEIAWSRARIEEFQKTGVDQAFLNAQTGWQQYFDQAADFFLGDPELEFLALQAQYTLRAGANWKSGIPLGTLWTQKFGGMTFWDSFFAAEGMARANHVSEMRDFCDWLVQTARPTGRPHYWMTYSDGTPGSYIPLDIAIHNCLTYASVCIRLSTITRDPEDINLRTLPYLRKLFSHLLDEWITAEHGGWHLRGKVSHDINTSVGAANEEVVVTKNEASSEHTIFAWCAFVAAKLVEFSPPFEGGSDSNQMLTKAREFSEWARKNKIRLEESNMWFHWFPYLCPAHPLVDYEGSWKPHFLKNENHWEGGGMSAMPWVHASLAASLLIMGMPGSAYENIDQCRKYVYGMGYLTEGTYESQCGGNAPYVPSSGAFLSSVYLMFANGSSWDDSIEICTGFAPVLRSLRIDWKNVLTPNGALISGRWTPDQVDLTISSSNKHSVTLRIPERFLGEPIRVTVDGRAVCFRQSYDTVHFEISPGSHCICLCRDLETHFPVLIPHAHGAGLTLRDDLKTAGVEARILRSCQYLPALTPPAKVIIQIISWAGLDPYYFTPTHKAVREGAALIGLFHAGVTCIDGNYAALTGVNAAFDRDWDFVSTERHYLLTPEGQALLPALPARFSIPTCQEFRPRLAVDVVVLAIDEKTGLPLVTRRPVGKGWAYWLAPGNTFVDLLPEYHHHFGHTGEILVGNKKRDAMFEARWLHSPDFKKLLFQLISLHL